MKFFSYMCSVLLSVVMPRQSNQLDAACMFSNLKKEIYLNMHI